MEQKPKNLLNQFARVGKVFSKQFVITSNLSENAKPQELIANELK